MQPTAETKVKDSSLEEITLETSRKHSILETSNLKFKSIYDSGQYKYRYLPEWLDTKSNMFEKEIRVSKNKTKKTFKKFKRGTIVYIEFGVNIGSEMAGRHFGIVVSKNDSRYNPVLQVIPLSSKKKRDYISISKEVFETSAVLLTNHNEQLVKRYNKINKKVHELRKEIEESVKDTDSMSIDEFKEYQDSRMEQVSEIEPQVENLRRDILMLDKVERKYQLYAKDSYLCAKNITTISKDRILKMNKFDPSGDVKVSNDTLDLIDKTFMSLFTNI